MNKRFLTKAVAATALAALAGAAGAQEIGSSVCGNPFISRTGVGPFDYMDPMEHANQQHIPTLEKHHFNADVRAGRKGQSSYILRDLDFILNACPNHHGALNVLLKYHLKHNPPVSRQESPACYLDRAARFNGDDGTVRLLAGIYYARAGNNDRALQAYSEGIALMPDSADLHYNIGLLYAKLDRLEEANEHAVRAYSLGAQLPGLKRKLIRLGAWNPDISEPQAANPLSAGNEEQP